MERGDKGHRKGLWTEEEDRILMDYIRVHGKGRWNRVAKTTGLKRCGKSCRLRWINYLSPSIKHGDFSEEEDDLIIRLHNLLGNRWSLIAGRVPGRTDNQVKNHWNTHLSKKLGMKKQRNKLKAPSETLPPERNGVENVSALADTCFELPFDDNFRIDDQNYVQSEARCFGLEVPGENEGCENPFWFANDESILSPPALTQLLDQYSLDNLFWHGL